MKTTAGFAALLALVPLAVAQSAEYGQCGGIGWTGATTCVSGTTCQVLNSYYSQCLPGAASASPPPPVSSPVSPTSTAGGAAPSSSGLNDLAKAIGKKYFGSATSLSELTDEPYVAILSNNAMFGQITPGNEMKWDATEPEQGVFTFSDGDQIVAFATANGQIMRGHNLVWYSQLPNWVTADNFTAAQLTSVIQTHVSNLVSHYKGQIYAWDVLNEPLADDGTMRADVFYNTLGDSFMNIALTQARASDPNAKLYINDYNIEGQSTKSNSMASLVSMLLSQGVPVDGIGLESHFIVDELPSGIQQQMETYTALGVEIAITELDIRMTLPSTTTLLSEQATNYETIVSACAAVAKCVGITVWDYTDKYSWVPATFPGQGDACPWDENLVEKPAFSGIVSALT